jgi:hypothetical protein
MKASQARPIWLKARDRAVLVRPARGTVRVPFKKDPLP